MCTRTSFVESFFVVLFCSAGGPLERYAVAAETLTVIRASVRPLLVPSNTSVVVTAAVWLQVPRPHHWPRALHSESPLLVTEAWQLPVGQLVRSLFTNLSLSIERVCDSSNVCRVCARSPQAMKYCWVIDRVKSLSPNVSTNRGG